MTPDGYVEIGGLLKRSLSAVTPMQHKDIFTLPAGYAPWANFRATLMDSQVRATCISIDHQGIVRCQESTGVIGGWLNLDGIRFQASGGAARVDKFGGVFPYRVKLTAEWPAKTCHVVAVRDNDNAEFRGGLGGATCDWRSDKEGGLWIDSIWGLQPGKKYKVTLLATAG